MGLFSKKKQPEVRVPSAQDLYQQALSFAQGNFPQAMKARESAASYLTSQPFDQRVTPRYEAFGPSSFEEALGNQYFQNLWPDMQRQIRQSLSLSGMASSPILAQTEAKAYGDVGYNVGKYLTDIARQKAETEASLSEQARQFNVASALGLDPMSMISPYVGTAQTQSAAQSQAEFQNYLNEMQGGSGGTIGSLLGMGLGAVAAPFTAGLSLLPAMAIGGGLGGQIGSMFGGSSPIDMGSALQISQMPAQMQTQNSLNDSIQRQLGKATAVKQLGKATAVKQ